MSGSLFDRPILIYSNFCMHSQNFLKLLMKHPDLYALFIRMNIDVDPETKKRPQIFYQIQESLGQKIVQVPTVIVRDDSQVLVLSDTQAFDWLDFQTQPERELNPFNPNEMGAFSDGYSKFGSTNLHDATEQSFKFFQSVDGKNVLQGESFKCGPIKGPDSFKETSTEPIANPGSIYKRLEFERQKPTQQEPQPQFQQKGHSSAKQKDLDSRLQQLIEERKNLR